MMFWTRLLVASGMLVPCCSAVVEASTPALRSAFFFGGGYELSETLKFGSCSPYLDEV